MAGRQRTEQLGPVEARDRLLVIVARPGAGRTTWLDALQADARDRWVVHEPGGTRLVAAGEDLDLPSGPPATVADAWPVIAERGASSLFANLTASGGVLGIDDLHLLSGVAELDVLEQVQAYGRHGARVVVTSRTMPPWLPDLAVESGFRLILDEQLALSTADVAAAAGLDPEDPPPWVRWLVERTDGWATVVPAVRRLRADPVAPTDRRLGILLVALRAILTTRVLAHRDAREVDLLVASARLGGLTVSLADVLFGPRAGTRLVALAQRETTLVPGPMAGSFEVPPLLRRGLQDQIARDPSLEPPGLIRRAADWHVSVGDGLGAAQLLAAHHQWADSFALLLQIGRDEIQAGRAERLWDVIASLPQATWAADPTAALNVALTAFASGHHEDGFDVLSRSPITDHDLPLAAQAVADALRAHGVLYGTGAHQAIAAAERAIQALDAVDETGIPVLMAARSAQPNRQLAAIGAGRAETLLYRWDAARDRLTEVAGDPSSTFLVRLNARAAAARVLALRGDLQAARRLVADALAAAEHQGIPDHAALADAHLAAATIGLWTDDTAAAEAASQHAEAAARRHRSDGQLLAALTLRAEVALRAGDPEAALRILEPAPSAGLDAVGARATAVQARTLARVGRHREATVLLAKVPLGPDTVQANVEVGTALGKDLAGWKAPRWPGPRLVAFLAQAVAALRGHDEQAVDALLAAALAIGEGEQLRGPFLDLPAAVQARLPDDPSTWRPLAEGPTGPAPAAPDPLTLREAEVLAALASGATIADVARASFVSVNTLKTHLRNIYRKLGVSSRNEAVDAARRHGLV